MRWRNVLLTASSALLIAGCGGDDPQVEERTVTGPTIERTVADQLATRSDAIANLLDSGDACGAREEAARLRGELTGAINEGAIPEPYLEDLSGLVNEIEAAIPACNPPPPSPPPPAETETDRGGDGDD